VTAGVCKSDSEDEVGGGVYGQSRIPRRTATAKQHVITFDDPSVAQGAAHLVVAVGSAGADFAARVKKEGTSYSVSVDDVVVATYYALVNGGPSLLVISSRLPNAVLYPLSSWILESLKPHRLSILDIYPTPLYIQPRSTSLASHPIRYLQTSLSTKVLSPIKPFAAPNLLSTQTLSSSLICVAQQRNVPALLLLLPLDRIPHLPPRTLDDDIEEATEATGWDFEAIFKAFEVDSEILESGKGHSGGAVSKSRTGTKAKSFVGDGGMYI